MPAYAQPPAPVPARLVYVSPPAPKDSRYLWAVLSSIVCGAAGVWALWQGHGSIWSALGLYFIGKAFFVGPQLVYGAR